MTPEEVKYNPTAPAHTYVYLPCLTLLEFKAPLLYRSNLLQTMSV
jgi:hypothetical protein